MTGRDFYHIPIGAATQTWAADNTPVPPEHTFQDIETQVFVFGFAAVMIHPQEHALRNGSTMLGVNATQIQNLETLLGLVKNAGVRLELYMNSFPFQATNW